MKIAIAARIVAQLSQAIAEALEDGRDMLPADVFEHQEDAAIEALRRAIAARE